MLMSSLAYEMRDVKFADSVADKRIKDKIL